MYLHKLNLLVYIWHVPQTGWYRILFRVFHVYAVILLVRWTLTAFPHSYAASNVSRLSLRRCMVGAFIHFQSGYVISFLATVPVGSTCGELFVFCDNRKRGDLDCVGDNL